MQSAVNQGAPPLLFVDLGMATIAATVAFGWPHIGNRIFTRVERLFAVLSSRRNLAPVIVGLSVLLLRIAILPIYGIPIPFGPADFSFLLAADTFAHGRLTNPTPPLWTHFETLHVTMVPTYQSMYFPGQGLLLGVSQALVGNPWWGILLSSALMCAVLTWALQAWIPANWALLGGFIAVLRIGLFSYWTNTYHAAGSLGALAGALILGSLPRLKKTGAMRYGLLMATGISILEITRPYEGMLLCLPVAIALVHWLLTAKSRPPSRVLARRAALPLAMIAATSAWLSYYDLKAFGSATTLPYTVDRAQYAVAPYYVWQHPKPVPNYRHPSMRAFYQVAEMESVRKIQSIPGFIRRTLLKPYLVLLFFSSFTLVAPLIMLRRVLLDRRVRFLVICVAVLAVGMAIEIFLLPHYVAPFLMAFYAIGLQAMRHLRLWRPEGRPVGRGLVRLIVISCILLTVIKLLATPLHLGATEWPSANWNQHWFGPERFGVPRADVERQLEALPGQQLAIVRYGSRHEPLDEWVYNRANIDDAKVVWAQDMGAGDNLELIHYFQGRGVWLVEPDAAPVRVTPYPVPQQSTEK